jgi:NAD(P) transhydrogenase subunit alpha
MPEHSSELYARNVSALLELMLDEGGAVVPDWSDEVLATSCVTRVMSETSDTSDRRGES